MSDQASNTIPQEKIQMKAKIDSKKRKHSSHSAPIDVELADVDIYDWSDSTPPLDQNEMETAKPGLDKCHTLINKKRTEEGISPQRKAALDYLDKAREAVSAIKAQTADINFDLKSIFPFMDLPSLEFPFIETPVKPERCEPKVTFVSQGQQTEADDIDSCFAKLQIKTEPSEFKVVSARQNQQGKQYQQDKQNEEAYSVTPVKIELSEPEMVSMNQGEQAQQGEEANSHDIFTRKEGKIEASMNTEPPECGLALMSQAQQDEQGEEAQEDAIIAPMKAMTETQVIAEPAEL